MKRAIYSCKVALPKILPGGAYVLHLKLKAAVKLNIASRLKKELPSGFYLYVGSARSGIVTRVERHRKLARTKTGKIHWHIDYLLTHADCRLMRVEMLPEAEECQISKNISRRKDIMVPIPGFGSSDCRSGCRAHLYRSIRPDRNLG